MWNVNRVATAELIEINEFRVNSSGRINEMIQCERTVVRLTTMHDQHLYYMH